MKQTKNYSLKDKNNKNPTYRYYIQQQQQQQHQTSNPVLYIFSHPIHSFKDK